MKRRTAGLLDEEAALVAAYAVPGTAANRALDVLVPQVVVRSESSAIRALVLAGLRAAQEEQLRSSYDRAVEAGEIDPETQAWYVATAHHAAILWGQE